MAEKRTTHKAPAAARHAPAKAPLAPSPFERVVDRVRRDAGDRPADYLKQTEVPGGGE